MAIKKFDATRFRWSGVPEKVYKTNGTHFRDISRFELIKNLPGLACQLRYFEIQPGGYSSLERHQHAHAVLILRGSGQVLIGDSIAAIEPFDVVEIPPMTWHQFYAADNEPLGFLCIVDCERDRPQRPTPEELEQLRANPAIAAMIRV